MALLLKENIKVATDSIKGNKLRAFLTMLIIFFGITALVGISSAIDAMKGAGKLSVKIIEDHHTVKINVSDTGKGIPKNQFKRVFEPGFTTKKRGWGLGLSLTKRIVESYHKGTVKVLHSEVDKGTIMQICYKKLE